jgi:hypothetical protein
MRTPATQTTPAAAILCLAAVMFQRQSGFRNARDARARVNFNSVSIKFAFDVFANLVTHARD